MQNIDFQNNTNLPIGYGERIHNALRFGLFIPPNYEKKKKYPLILSLHGKLDITSWNLPWYHEPIVSSDPCIVITPKTLNPNFAWGNSSFENHTPEMLTVIEIIDLLKKEFSVDENRLYLHGASMGGFGVFNLLAKEPGMFAAAFAVCGGGSPSTANVLKETPLWIFHGDSDPTISVEQSRNLFNAIINAGGKKVRYTEYPGVGHDSWINAWKEPTLLNWLLAQKKNKKAHFPKPITNLKIELAENSKIRLSWNPSPSKNIWYYKIYCNSKLIGEIDNIFTDFTDEIIDSKNLTYSVICVNYFFRESDPQSITLNLLV
jgi:predicted peptidase